MLTIKGLCKESNERAHRKGWYEAPVRTIPEALCLIHSEVSEALEDVRDGQMGMYFTNPGLSFDQLMTGAPLKPCGFPSELADIVIRVCDLAEEMGIDLEYAIRLKSDYNETRPMRHGGKKL